MGAMGQPESSGASAVAAPEPLVCDFCGETVRRVRRVALDGDYDRLQKPHVVQYACHTCSEAKERRRLGVDRS
jgi:hypothetical protein